MPNIIYMKDRTYKIIVTIPEDVTTIEDHKGNIMTVTIKRGLRVRKAMMEEKRGSKGTTSIKVEIDIDIDIDILYPYIKPLIFNY